MNSDIRALIDKAKESLRAAEHLLQDGYSDFAASRAYYAMFYVAEALLAHLGQSYTKHSSVIAAFGRAYAKSGRFPEKLHRWLIDAQDIRNIGDYGIEAHVSSDQAKDVCEWAREFIQTAEHYLNKQDG